MLLHRLYSNKSSFREIKFNEKGLSIIRAERTSSDGGATHNGVGKTLALYLINYCLGADKNDAFEKYLSDWSFSLDFSISGIRHTITRTIEKQNRPILDNEAIGIKKYRNWLQNEIFKENINLKFLTFRLIIPQFLRYSVNAFGAFDQPTYKDPYQDLLRFSFFTGLNLNLVSEKRELREEETEKEGEFKTLQSNETIKSFFIGTDNIEEISKELDTNEQKLQQEMNELSINVDYEKLNNDSLEIQRNIRILTNQRNLLTNSVDNINYTIEKTGNDEYKTISSLYKNTQNIFPDSIKKSLQELLEFNNAISQNRVTRLEQAKTALSTKIKTLDQEIQQHKDTLKKIVNQINEQGILKDLILKFENIIFEKEKISRWRDYYDLLKNYEQSIKNIQEKLAVSNEITSQYLENNAIQSFDRFKVLFAKYIAYFYPNATTKLIVKNNTGDNKIRFDYDICVDADSSTGINEVKIFCYDFSCLMLSIHHKIKFLFHDSSLLSNIDPLQQKQLLQLAQYEATLNDMQYIASLNKDQIKAIEDTLEDPEEYKKLIEDNTVITLTEKEDEKLLGINIPQLRYDS